MDKAQTILIVDPDTDLLNWAKHQLETVPVARPVIFTLIGCERGERCVIERTEEDFASRIEDTCASHPDPGWPRLVHASTHTSIAPTVLRSGITDFAGVLFAASGFLVLGGPLILERDKNKIVRQLVGSPRFVD